MTLPSTVFCGLFIKLKHIRSKKRDLFHGSSSLYCRSDHRADFFLQYFWCEHCRVFHRLGKERYFRFISQHCFTGSHFQFRDLKYISAYLHKKKERLHDVLPCKILNSFQRELRNKPAGDHIPGILLELLYRQRYVRSCGIPIP